MRLLMVTVLRRADGCDCTNNGVTSRHATMYVPCEDGNFTQNDVNPEQILHFESGYFKGHGSTRRAIMGGNYVVSSDSRFIRTYGRQPLPVYDRIEN